LFLIKHIKFKKILLKDLKKVLIWRNSSFVRLKMLNQKKIYYKHHLQWFKNLRKNSMQKNYIIYYKKNQIGVASIKEINSSNKTCTWGYYIADISFRYLATLVQFRFLDLIFNKLQIRKIWGETISTNKRILKIHRLFGFIKEGTYRKHIKVKNRYEDIILTSLFKNDWNIYKKKLLRKLT
jgi:UDP-4-amino-4,6-dideoxy-N-acetyl-beta-L-altrosamine N-acetyltransferase